MPKHDKNFKTDQGNNLHFLEAISKINVNMIELFFEEQQSKRTRKLNNNVKRKKCLVSQPLQQTF